MFTNPANPNHIYISDDEFLTLARAGVQPERIDAMRATRDAAEWVAA